MDQNEREKVLRERLEVMKGEDSALLKEKIKAGKEAQEFVTAPYWQKLKAEIQGHIKAFQQAKSWYNFSVKYVNPDEGEKQHYLMSMQEAITGARQEILDVVQFHIQEGKLASAALSQKEKPTMKK